MRARRTKSPLEALDGRGRRVQLYAPPETELLLASTPDGFTKDEFARVRRKITGAADGHWRGLAMFGLVAVTIGLVVQIPGAIFDKAWFRLAWIVSTNLVFIGCLCIVLRGLHTASGNADAWRKRFVATFLNEKRCPGCAYRLGGLVSEDDGCTVCPECGAAWRLPQ